MLSPSLALFIVLAAAPGGRRDAAVDPDVARPPWLPTPVTAKSIYLSEQALYRLRRTPDGYVYDTPSFEARVAFDGVVTFKDKKTSFGGVGVPWKPLAQFRGPTLRDTSNDDFDKRHPRPPSGPEESGPVQLPTAVDWGTVCPHGSDCNVQPDATLVQVRGNLDLTDELMAAYGQDPFAREKASFLSATFDFRMELAKEAHKAALESALLFFPERLDALWADRRYTLRERRRILYELWREADQTSEGRKVAEMIGLFIHQHLPCSSPEAYTADELKGFARAHPGRHFSPGDCPSRPAGK